MSKKRRKRRASHVIANIQAFEKEEPNFTRVLRAFGFTVERLTRKHKLTSHYAVCDKSGTVVLEYRAHKRVIHYKARRTYRVTKIMDVAAAAIEGKAIGENRPNPPKPDALTREFHKIARGF